MASKYCTDLAKICEDLHDRFHLINETDEPLRSQIKRFWQDIGLPFPGVATPWSAAFVSSCVKKAGVSWTPPFRPAESPFGNSRK